MSPELARCMMYTIIGYLSGGMMFAYWVPRILRHVDVRDYGEDRNPGGFNAITACGMPIGVLCIALDILKGTLPVLAALRIGGLAGWFLLPVVIAPVAGHAWPLLHGGHGGKAISVSFGVFIALLPELLLAVIWAACYLALLPLIHDHRVLTQVSSLLLLICTFQLYPLAYVRVMTAGVVGILQIKHRRVNTQPEKNPLQPA